MRNFDIEVPVKRFPTKTEDADDAVYKKRFDGYCAVHYRLRIPADGVAEERYSRARVELQVASLLMHAWAEVEHDLGYKPETGQPSEDEFAILDEINGLVIAGEIALSGLQRAVEQRITSQGRQFKNPYDLAAYIYYDRAQASTRRRWDSADWSGGHMSTTSFN